ncbi:MAG: DUF4054 domain-containing protein [Acholeplasmataceae bacterium]
MSDVTAADVKNILDTSLEEADINAFIGGAAALVDSVVGTVTDTLKFEIVRWLTAHLIASTREQQIAEATAGPASVKFQGQSGLGLNSTQYGQQVKILDASGKLAALDKQKVAASLFAIGSFE